jgi:hypothetical protein
MLLYMSIDVNMAKHALFLKSMLTILLTKY